MISDYLERGYDSSGEGEKEPVFDMWGVVLAASDHTEAGNVRVRVKLMKDKMDIFDNVPVLTGYGGADYGVFCMPEEGDIVRLVFPGRDFRHPVAAGCRFPESSQFVKNMQEEKTRKAFRAKNGSGVFFAGEKGKDSIEVSGSQKMNWKLDEEKERISFGDKDGKNYVLIDKKNRKTQVISEDSVRLECGKSSLELKKDGTIVLKCEKLEVEAKAVELHGKSRVQVKGQEVVVEGAAGISVKGKGQIKVESKGQLKLSGAMIHLN